MSNTSVPIVLPIKTEEKARVVAAVRGTELIKFLAAPVFFHQDDEKEEKDE